MKSLTLEELRKCEIGCLKSIHTFCEENNLKYYLTFGSLLGAIRHHGFIPWDDDMDIIMPRKDYNYLIEHYYDEKYKLISIENEPRCYTAHAKLIDTNTVLTEKQRSFEIGAFVDIFVLDNLPNNRIKRFIFGNYVQLKRLLFSLPRADCTRQRPFYKTALIKLAKKLYNEEDIAKIDFGWKYPQKYINQAGTEYYGLLYKRFPVATVLDAKWFEEQVPVEFEGEIFYAPCGYDEFLSYCFGDYHKLPPVEQQKTHHYFTCYWKDD